MRTCRQPYIHHGRLHESHELAIQKNERVEEIDEQLPARKDQPLLRWWHTGLLLDLFLDTSDLFHARPLRFFTSNRTYRMVHTLSSGSMSSSIYTSTRFTKTKVSACTLNSSVCPYLFPCQGLQQDLSTQLSQRIDDAYLDFDQHNDYGWRGRWWLEVKESAEAERCVARRTRSESGKSQSTW